MAPHTSAGVWWPVIQGARWFAGKGRPGTLMSVTALGQYTPDGGWPCVRSEIARVHHDDDDSTAWYQLIAAYYPVGAGPRESLVGTLVDADLGEIEVHDAPKDPAAMAAVLDALLAERAGEGYSSERVAGTHVPDELTPQVFAGEQSNTSVMFNPADPTAAGVMLKWFRRLELGRNLDIEVHAELGRQGVGSVATLFGAIEGSWPTGEHDSASASLAMLVEKLRNATDGWDAGTAACASGTDFRADAAALGTALVEIHRSLAEGFPTATLAGDEVAATMDRRLDAAVAIAEPLRALAGGIRAAFDALAGRSLPVQRVHGDFHLGQTLTTDTGWKIIDFEGEPLKTMDERLAPDSRWRDVAGMLRSFDYARSAHADPSGSEATAWAQSAGEAFLAAYGADLDDGERAVLNAYILDKAVYEVVYEVRNRPDWVRIPLGAVENAIELDTRGAAPPVDPPDEGFTSPSPATDPGQ